MQNGGQMLEDSTAVGKVNWSVVLRPSADCDVGRTCWAYLFWLTFCC